MLDISLVDLVKEGSKQVTCGFGLSQSSARLCVSCVLETWADV